MRRNFYFIFFSLLLLPFEARTESFQKIFRSMSVGAELGGSLNFMISDSETNATGMGLGSHWGFYAVTNRKNSDWNFKLRIESVNLREESLADAETDYLVADTHLKTLEQDWFMIGLGVENRTDKKHYIFFWEAYLGFASGGKSEVFLRSDTVDAGVIKAEIDSASPFYLGGGFGFKKRYQNRISIFTSLRTFFTLGGVYAESELKNKTLFPLPFLITLGAEYQL